MEQSNSKFRINPGPISKDKDVSLSVLSHEILTFQRNSMHLSDVHKGLQSRRCNIFCIISIQDKEKN